MCWTEIGDAGLPIRIFKNRMQAVEAGCPLGGAYMLRAAVVESIRRQVFERDKFKCTHCGCPVTWRSGEMHERKWRGRGGEISLENSTTLCYPCHQSDPVAGHGKRQPQW
jgi:hypothetical protein